MQIRNYSTSDLDRMNADELGHLLMDIIVQWSSTTTKEVEFLLSIGANPNAIYRYWSLYEELPSVLGVAVGRNSTAITKLLLDYGSDPNDGREYFYFKTTLFYAVLFEKEEFVRLLLEYGADPNLRIVPEDYSIGVNRIDSILQKACRNKNAEIARLLIKYGADPHIIDKHGCGLLDYYPYHSHTDVCRVLLEAGVQPATVSMGEFLVTCMRHMDADHYADLVELCSTSMADLNYRASIFDKTALHYAIENGSLEAVQSLLAKGADPNTETWGRKNVLYDAIKNKRHDILKLLLDYGADPGDKYDVNLITRYISPYCIASTYSTEAVEIIEQEMRRRRLYPLKKMINRMISILFKPTIGRLSTHIWH